MRRASYFSVRWWEDKELSSYTLGFACSDGCLTHNGKYPVVGLYSSEKEHIEKIQEALGYSGMVNVARKAYSSYKTIWGLTFHGANASIFLDLGLKRKEEQSFLDLRVDIFPFLRGFLDGDGSIIPRVTSKGLSLDHLAFLTRERMRDSLSKSLEDMGFHNTVWPVSSSGRVWKISLSKKPGMALLEKMYLSPSVCLSRKRTSYEALLKAL